MRDKNHATTSLLKRILVNCSAQAKQYGSCVSSRVPEVEQDMCLKEFLLLKSCMQNVEEKLSNMIGEASSSGHSCFSGSNALSHVYIQYPPLRCHIPGSRRLFYDDGNKLILSLTSNQVFSWKTAPYNPYAAPSSDPISEGPVLSIRYSLDLKLLAIQRSSHEIQIWNKETGDTFSQKCRPESESILGFFWTDCPTCDIVFVKTSGLELFSCNAGSRSLHLVETKKLNISWFIYTHESRLVLLASGMQCKSFTGYQLSSAGIVRLPRFEMVMAKSEANDKPILAAEDIHIITVWQDYCLQFDRVAMLLHSYRFYRDAVVPQGSLPIYSNRIAVSVVDKFLLVHQVEAKIHKHLFLPLPLLLRGFSRANAASSQITLRNSGASESKDLSDTEAISASSSEVPLILEFLQRRKLEADKARHLCLGIVRTIILERKPVPMVSRAIDILLTAYSHAIKTGSYYKRIIAEETSASGASNLSRPSAVVNESITGVDASGKFSRQEPESGTENESYRSDLRTSDSDGSLKMNSQNPDQPIGTTERGYLLEPDAAGAEVLPAGQSQSPGPSNNQLNSNASERHQPQVTASAAASPADLYGSVFTPVDEEMGGDGSYLTAILVEFLRSASLEKLKVDPNIYVLMAQILGRDERYAELGLFVMNKIIEPSKEVALQLLESGRENLQIRKLGLGMLRQLSLHHDYVLLLVQDGYYLEALRYARKHQVNTVRPSLFLEAAHSSKDPLHVAVVLRFFSDFIPGFKSTADHHMYHRIVAEMNTCFIFLSCSFIFTSAFGLIKRGKQRQDSVILYVNFLGSAEEKNPMENNFYAFLSEIRSDVGNLWIFGKWSIDVSGSGASASFYLDNVPMVLL
ncbi:UNVERIFIED_CONTAM: Regulator of MON1-CCZ1 complex [Sesamum angustifolium]|uniref:Regulator of MON1-CCZ1 complex n=1 Tax=Sesamum angustifolium TaxID=2727405 RepID=A0AAW2PV95_9LAMI